MTFSVSVSEQRRAGELLCDLRSEDPWSRDGRIEKINFSNSSHINAMNKWSISEHLVKVFGSRV